MLQPTLRFLAVVASIRACSEVDGCMCRNDRRQCAFVDDGESRYGATRVDAHVRGKLGAPKTGEAPTSASTIADRPV